MDVSEQELSFYYPGSNGRAVLLVHGLTGSPTEMDYLGKKLHKNGFTVYAPLLAGHGGSVEDLVKTTWHDWYSSVEQAYKRLASEVKFVSVAGVCVGGALGLNLADNHQVSSVVIYSPTLRYDGWNMPKIYRMAPLFRRLAYLPLVNKIKFKETYPFGLKDRRLCQMVSSGKAIIEGALDYFPIKSLAQMYDLNEVIKNLLPKITTPTLLIHALEDDISHPRNAEYIAKNIGGTCKIEWMKNSYHMLHVDQERRKVAELTADFCQTND